MTASGHSEVIDQAVTGRPDRRIAGAVARYVGYRQRGVAPAVHLGLPSPYLTFIVTLDEPLTVAQHVDPRRSPGSYRTLVGGLHTSPAVITHDGAQSGVQLLVDPLAARALLGVPAAAIAGHDGEADELLGALGPQLQARVSEAPTWPQRFAVVDAAVARLLERREGSRAPHPAVAGAWHLLLTTGGRMPIRAVADEVGYGQRHLSVQFRNELGLTPKVAARIIRFDRARRVLQRPGPAVDLAAVAALHGYFDQSHLDRDFVDFTGRPPSRWLAEEIGNVQAAASSDGGR